MAKPIHASQDAVYARKGKSLGKLQQKIATRVGGDFIVSN